MSMRFLSTEWTEALSERLNATEAVRTAAAGVNVTIQQVITAGEDIHYWTTIADGTITMGIGDVASPDATITQSYETAVALAKREMNPVTGFMMGKIKVAGNMGLLLSLQALLSQLADAMAALDVEY